METYGILQKVLISFFWLTLFKMQFFMHPKTSLLLKKALKRKVVV